jgi:hypothetical protein
MERDVTLTFGKTGMGKTQWAIRYLRAIKRAIILDPLGEYTGMEFYDLNDMIDFVKDKKIFRVRTPVAEHLDGLSEIARSVGNVCLVIEEAQRIIPPAQLLPDAFEDVIYRGRHQRVSVVTVAQRASTTHIAMRSQWTRLITFGQTEPNDVKWLEQTTGFDMGALLTFPPGRFCDVRPDRIEYREIELTPTHTASFDNAPGIVIASP